MTSENSAAGTRTGGVEQHLAKHGKVSYMQIPAHDTALSADFYRDIFGWTILGGNADHRSFADASGAMIGAFVTGRAIAGEPGILPYIYVEGIDAVVGQITGAGGSIVKAPYPEGGLWIATFRDPAGNTVGVWQQGPR